MATETTTIGDLAKAARRKISEDAAGVKDDAGQSSDKTAALDVDLDSPSVQWGMNCFFKQAGLTDAQRKTVLDRAGAGELSLDATLEDLQKDPDFLDAIIQG